MSRKDLKWKCIENCGACCRLAPLERTEAISLLNEEQQKTYFEMVDDQGWCKHLDKTTKKCKVYKTRPDFCHVSFINAIYKIDLSNHSYFAINNCRSHIKTVYGKRSKQLRRYQREIHSIK